MYSTRLCLFIFSLLFPSGSWAYAECYYPDRSIVPNYQPCNPAQVKVNGTACCDLSNSVCSTGGFCHGNARFIYRGGCTDPNWASPNCAKECLNIAQGTFSNLLPCSSGVYTEHFCCSDVPGSPAASLSCCDKSFKFIPGNPYAPPSNVQDDTATSTLSASSSTSTSSGASTRSSASASSSTQISSSIVASSIVASSNTALPSSSALSPILTTHTTSKNSITIGVGIGVPLGLLLLLSLGFLYKERQRRAAVESLNRENQIAFSRTWQSQPHNGYPQVFNAPGPHELEHTHVPPSELVVEVGNEKRC